MNFLPRADDLDGFRRSRELVAHLEASALFQLYREAFERATGMPLALRPSGSGTSPLFASDRRSAFCAILAADAQADGACRDCQREVETHSQSRAHSARCHAGLTETLVPIRIGDRAAAFLQTGQVRHQPASSASLTRVARQFAALGPPVDDPRTATAYQKVPVIPKARYAHWLKLLAIFAEHLAARANELMIAEQVDELPSVARARAFIAQHRTQSISLAAVAAAAHLSPFHFCKTFRKVTGVTFIDYLARLRVEQVKELLLNPHRRVSEAAFESGFQSLSQFNRVFRRVTGESPGDYRHRLHGGAAPAGAG